MVMMAFSGAFQDYFDVWGIPDKKLLDGVKATYSAADRLLVFSYSEEGATEGVGDGKELFYECKWSTPLHNPYTRKLVNESHSVFVAATKISKDANEISDAEILKISQRYHSILLVCIEDLDNALGTESEKEEYEIQKVMFSEIELLWSLLELLFIDIQSSHRIIQQLLGWIQWNFPEPMKKAKEIMKSEDPAFEHSDYWDTITQFVLRGQMDEARSLLKAHETSNREDFRSMDELLKAMPMFMPKVGLTLIEFRMRWQHWRGECQRRLDRCDFPAESNLEVLCKILCGDMDVLMDKSYLCTTWYIHLVSVLLYTDPCVTVHELGKIARLYSANMNGDAPLSRLDSIILAALELDVMKVIKDCCTYEDGWWFVTHMYDLFYHKGNLTGEAISHPMCLQEFLVLGYADSLMTHRSLWQIGVDYLDQCIEIGRQYLELYIERIPLDSEAKARKVLHVAKQKDMESLIKSVCKIMTVKAIQNGMLGTALKWVLESKDVQFATDLAQRWIKEYSETGKFECYEVLSNLGFCMLVSDKLTFVDCCSLPMCTSSKEKSVGMSFHEFPSDQNLKQLWLKAISQQDFQPDDKSPSSVVCRKYCEFHRLYQGKEYKQAASILVSLLASGLVPKGFQMVLLNDALPLLEASVPVFSMEETSKLMACLDSITASFVKNEEPENFHTKERMIRLALARNLANAFVEESEI